MLAVLAIAFSMSADAFAAALGKGAALDRLRLAEALRTGLVFGAVEAATPMIGWAFGFALSGYVEAVDHWIAFALLGALGLRMIRGSVLRAAGAPRPERHSLGVLAMTALGTSIDALIVGVTLALIKSDIVVTALAIGAATFLMATAGVALGRAAGARLGRMAEAAGGFVLIALGTAILFQHLGAASAAG